jgi:hypothetical protein
LGGKSSRNVGQWNKERYTTAVKLTTYKQHDDSPYPFCGVLFCSKLIGAEQGYKPCGMTAAKANTI